MAVARRICSGLLLGLWLGSGIPGAESAPASPAGFNAGGTSGLVLAQADRLFTAGQVDAARELVVGLAEAGKGGPERDFLDGMISYSGRDYRRAEAVFRRILDHDPKLLRVRLELARTLYMEKKDEEADYHFRLAAGEHPSELVIRNITRFREAIRARRSWRFNVDIGFAPDSNINSATDKQTVDIYGLPFQLDPSGRARSGLGQFAGADASVVLNRGGTLPIAIEAYGRWLRYRDHRFNDAYAGADVGPEFQLAGGRLRTAATGLKRWYGDKPLLTSFGARADYDRLIGNGWTVAGTMLLRHNDYAGRSDVDGWDAELRASVNRPLGPTVLGFGFAGLQRNWAHDPGQAFWRAQLGVGVLKEIGWGLRPQVSIDVARQVHDGDLAPFGKRRRDLLLEGAFSIYKRDWNLAGFAPSLRVTMTRNRSTVVLYHEKRFRAEIRLTRAF